jgi:hypothetical protein
MDSPDEIDTLMKRRGQKLQVRPAVRLARGSCNGRLAWAAGNGSWNGTKSDVYNDRPVSIRGTCNIDGSKTSQLLPMNRMYGGNDSTPSSSSTLEAVHGGYTFADLTGGS